MQSASKTTAGSAEIVLIAICTPSSPPIFSAAAAISASMRSSTRASGSRRSIVMNTSPGMTLGDARLHLQNADGADRFRMRAGGWR